MKVLLSIKPQFAERILNGTKLYEYRKTPFRNREFLGQDIKKVLIYATKPVGLVVGEFRLRRTIERPALNIWCITKEYSGISQEKFFEYFKSSNARACVHYIDDPIRLDPRFPGLSKLDP